MGLKKYEIITVGSDKRVRALRSWQVQDRYVNIGDVGGIVYDEKTLSQDGACWLFRGNFGFPGARIGGDSVVDVAEAAPGASGSANLDILGSSTVVGAPVRFSSDQTAQDAVTLTASEFEQGTFANYANGRVPGTSNSANFIRTKNPIFMGGAAVTLKLGVPGYRVLALVLDRDGFVISGTPETASGAGVTLAVPAGQYFALRITKDPMAAIAPADATAAQIKFTGTYETKLVVVDSRLELNQAASTGVITIRPGGTYTVLSGAKYPDSVIQNSRVVINATSNRGVHFMSDLSNVNAALDATTADAQAAGIYQGVHNLAFTGTVTSDWNEAARSLIQAYDCDNMVVSPTNFPDIAAMQTAGVPIRFYNCNLNNGRFYHHAQIANTYRDINFDLATADLGKITGAGHFLISSEVNGMYRLTNGTIITALVESHESVKSVASSMSDAYNTTIYADAYLGGRFDLRGTNVFGNKVRSHPLAPVLNVAPRAVQGMFNTATVGAPITGVVTRADRVCVPVPFRVNGSKGLTINCPTGIEGAIVCTDINGVVKGLTGLATGESSVPAAQLVNTNAYLFFGKAGGAAITPADLAGVTVTTYNGCRIISTKATGATIAGNVRVEDNATLIDVSVTGTGYFGGNSIVQAPSALAGQLPIEGVAYMSDNAVFAPSGANASAGLSSLDMKDNAVFAGRLGGAVKYNITMANNARFLGSHNSGNAWVLEGNSYVAPAAVVNASCEGVSIMEDNARIESGSITTVGYITLRGKYKQTAPKTWKGKRVISSQDAPAYDDNAKTKYDI